MSDPKSNDELLSVTDYYPHAESNAYSHPLTERDGNANPNAKSYVVSYTDSNGVTYFHTGTFSDAQTEFDHDTGEFSLKFTTINHDAIVSPYNGPIGRNGKW